MKRAIISSARLTDVAWENGLENLGFTFSSLDLYLILGFRQEIVNLPCK
jgi:hypothetical protein